MSSGNNETNQNQSFDIPTVTVNLETHYGVKTQDHLPDQPLSTLRYFPNSPTPNIDHTRLRNDSSPKIESPDPGHEIMRPYTQPDQPLPPEVESNIYHIPNIRTYGQGFNYDIEGIATNQYEIIPHGIIDIDELSKKGKDKLHQVNSSDDLPTDAGYSSDQRPLLNNGPQDAQVPVNNNHQNNSKKTSLTDFKTLKENYFRLTKCQKAFAIIVFLIALAAYTAVLVLILKQVIIPRIKKIEYFKFFCLYKDNLHENDSELCFISIAQTSFGIIAIGQVAIGIITISQLGFGVIIIAQLGFAILMTIFAQGALSLFIGYCQFGVSVIYTKGSMIAVSPVQSLMRPKNPYPFNLMCS